MNAKWCGAVAALTTLIAVGCGGADEDAQRTEPASTEPPSQAVKDALCYDLEETARLGAAGTQWGACGQLEGVERVREGVWLLQIRRGPVYCLELTRAEGPPPEYPARSTEVGEFGDYRLTEARCPASAYADEPKPDVQAELRDADTGAQPGFGALTVSLAAIGSERTRLVAEAESEMPLPASAFITSGRCRRIDKAPFPGDSFPLPGFFSFRSVTTLPVALEKLTGTPHAIYVLVESGIGARIEPPYSTCADIGS